MVSSGFCIPGEDALSLYDIKYFYCNVLNQSAGAIPLFVFFLFLSNFQIILLFIVFVLIGTLTKRYVAPSLNGLAKSIGIQENISGITLIGIGCSAPDIISAFYVAGLKDNGIHISLGILFCSCAILTTCVVALIAFISISDISVFCHNWYKNQRYQIQKV